MRPSILDVLLTACPSFEGYWQEIEPIYDGRTPAQVDDEDFLFEFARHTLELHQDSEEQAFPQIAAALHGLYEQGTQEDRDTVARLLNGIGYDWSDNGVDPGPFFRHVHATLQPFCITSEPEG